LKISEVKNNAFYQMPQWLYEEPYNVLSDKAKQIYMFLFDRRTLSIQNKWFDEEGDVFVYFTNEQLMEKLNCSNKPIIQAKKELSDYGLIKEVRQGVNKPNRLYILGSVESTQRKCRKYTSGSVESTHQEVSKVHTINTNNIKTEYIKTDNINYKEDEKKSFSQIIKSSNVKINERQSQQLLEYIGLDNMTVEMIEYAVQLTEDAGAESFNYLNKILKSWKDKGLTSIDEAKAETSGFRDSKNVTSTSRKVGNSIIQTYDDPLPF
jgi:DnaD/phage-associated family protein